MKKSIEMFNEIAENEEDYKKFYESFSKSLKLGIHEDNKNRKKLCELLRYYSSTSGDSMTSLKDDVERMHENQEVIYYITGENKQVVENSPFMEAFKKKNLEVLYMINPIGNFSIVCLKLSATVHLFEISQASKGTKAEEFWLIFLSEVEDNFDIRTSFILFNFLKNIQMFHFFRKSWSFSHMI